MVTFSMLGRLPAAAPSSAPAAESKATEWLVVAAAAQLPSLPPSLLSSFLPSLSLSLPSSSPPPAPRRPGPSWSGSGGCGSPQPGGAVGEPHAWAGPERPAGRGGAQRAGWARRAGDEGQGAAAGGGRAVPGPPAPPSRVQPVVAGPCRVGDPCRPGPIPQAGPVRRELCGFTKSMLTQAVTGSAAARRPMNGGDRASRGYNFMKEEWHADREGPLRFLPGSGGAGRTGRRWGREACVARNKVGATPLCCTILPVPDLRSVVRVHHGVQDFISQRLLCIWEGGCGVRD